LPLLLNALPCKVERSFPVLRVQLIEHFHQPFATSPRRVLVEQVKLCNSLAKEVTQHNASFLITEEKLVEITGLRPGTIERARKKCWMVGREYLHVSPDGVPKKNSECMYNRKAVDQWVESMSKKQPGARQ